MNIGRERKWKEREKGGLVRERNVERVQDKIDKWPERGRGRLRESNWGGERVMKRPQRQERNKAYFYLTHFT